LRKCQCRQIALAELTDLQSFHCRPHYTPCKATLYGYTGAGVNPMNIYVAQSMCASLQWVFGFCSSPLQSYARCAGLASYMSCTNMSCYAAFIQLLQQVCMKNRYPITAFQVECQTTAYRHPSGVNSSNHSMSCNVAINVSLLCIRTKCNRKICAIRFCFCLLPHGHALPCYYTA
jgi:hypothetical protein